MASPWVMVTIAVAKEPEDRRADSRISANQAKVLSTVGKAIEIKAIGSEATEVR